ncbi:MAG: ABC transporter substrate-binding protein [Clostridiales bacterium]|nr:ABC transporter substrate-binding protein [Clostridiales bacterium]
MKKIFSLFLILSLVITVFAGCDNQENTQADDEYNAVDIKVAALMGPTGMGMSKLMADSDAKKTANNYTFELFKAPTDLTGLIINGEFQIAAVPTNLAATLYNKTKGQVKLLALNTLGVLYILEKGETINSINDLEGKKIYSSGQAATPQYALDYVLKANNINCQVEYFSTHEELATQALAGNADIILIPEPQVSTILSKNAGFRIAVDFNKAWNDATNNSSLFSMGCLVVRKDFADSNPKAVEKFLEEYTASVKFVNENHDEASQIIANYKIVPNQLIAKNAIPNCKMVTISGEEMKTKTKPYLQILFDSDKKSIGGALPGEDFYY